MAFPAKQLARGLLEEVKVAEDLDTVIEAFIDYLHKENNLSKWREVARALDQVWKEEYGVANVEITTAHELSKTVQDKISEKMHGASVSVAVDSTRIGGASVRIDDRIVDGTIAGHLKALKQTMAN